MIKKTEVTTNQKLLKMQERFLTEFALPEFAYLPGKMIRQERKYLPHFSTAQLNKHWSENLAYLYGWDLFRNRFFYEAHEVWEEVWMKKQKGSSEKIFIQVLILVAAAGLKLEVSQKKPFDRLMKRADELLCFLSQKGEKELMGIELKDLSSSALLREVFLQDNPFPS